jgi:hypothetical protein
MWRFPKLALVLLLISALASPAWCQVVLPPPVPPNVVPLWTPVPGPHRVVYAPNINGDLFRYQGKYYYCYGGQWYKGPTATGPWHPVRKVPMALMKIHPSVFKTR